MHDLNAICNALALKVGAVSTPSGVPAGIKSSSGQGVTAIVNTPAAYVEVDDGEIKIGGGAWSVTHSVVVNFCLAKAPGKPELVDKWRQLWLVPLLQATASDSNLSVAGVDSAFPEKYEFAEITVGGELYDGIRIFYTVRIKTEAVSFTP